MTIYTECRSHTGSDPKRNPSESYSETYHYPKVSVYLSRRVRVYI